MNGSRHPTGKRIAWWLTWVVLTGHLVLLPLLLGIRLTNNAASEFGWRIVFVMLPLAIAVVLRWLVLPRIGSTLLAYFVSLGGLILVDMSGLMMLFLQPPYRVALYWLCVIGMLQFVPLFILKETHRSGSPADGGASGILG